MLRLTAWRTMTTLHDLALRLSMTTPPVNAAAERCTFDLAYSQVLGGVHSGATVDAPALACHALPIAELRVPRGDAFVVPYDSRGPPASS